MRSTLVQAMALLACIPFVPAAAADDVLSREEVGIALANVLGPLAKRQLTSEEKHAVAEEFIPLLGDANCTARCIEMIEYNAQRIAPVTDRKGTAADLLTRHGYISQLYFSPRQSGSLIQRLSAEADPITVVENAPQRLMTRSAVVASMNLYHFVHESGPPTARRFSESDVDAAAATLNNIYGSAEHIMPRHLALAAVYWRGLELGWSEFSDAQRAQVRAYFAAKRIRRPLSTELYVSLLGLAADDAKTFYMEEVDQALMGIVGAQFDVVVEKYKTEGYSWIWAPY